jgi:O-acetyl-ADP-ribose deacetylase (regulator of RNase III)
MTDSVYNIRYIKGDATNPIGDGRKYIIHCCNDCGKWGAGFVLALSRKWKSPEREYRKRPNYRLGDIQVCPVENDITIINMIGQHGIGRSVDGRPAIRYSAIRECLKQVFKVARGGSIHAPRFGAGLAGGDWNIIEALIKEELTENGIPVVIYDFE